MKGPAIFLAQYLGDRAPFNSLKGLAGWAQQHGYRGVQMPTTDARIFDLSRAARSRIYCDEIRGVLADHDLVITELSTHLQGQLLAVHPAYGSLMAQFAPPDFRENADAQLQWARQQLFDAAQASAHLALSAHATFSGSLLWPYLYPWPARPPGLVEAGFAELARRWRPILDAFDAAGVDVCFELHPGEDLHDGASFERFLEQVDQHPRANLLYDPSHLALQHMDYAGFIDHYHSRIKAFHVKDAELRRDARSGVYGGYQAWRDRAGRFRSVGDGDIDFRQIFSRLIQYGYQGWAVLEWECCLKDSETGAREGAAFIRRHLFNPAARAFDNFAATTLSDLQRHELLGLHS